MSTAGRSGNPTIGRSSPAFDVKRFLHPGENVIAVAVANWDGPGGINKGVTLAAGGKTGTAPMETQRI